MPALTTILRLGLDQKGRPDYRIDTGALARMEREELDSLMDLVPDVMEQMVVQWEMTRKERY